MQSTIFDAAIVNLFFSDNAADAEILGVEGDFVYITDNDLMLSGAFSFLDTELTKRLALTNDIVEGSELAFAPGYQANVTARKEYGLSSGNTGHLQGQITISDDSFSDIMEPNRAVQSGYSLANVRAGISNDSWIAELYIDNLTDTAKVPLLMSPLLSMQLVLSLPPPWHRNAMCRPIIRSSAQYLQIGCLEPLNAGKKNIT